MRYSTHGDFADRMHEASSTQVGKYLEEHPDRLKAVNENPEKELPKLARELAESKPAYFGDKWIYRWVAIALGAVVLIAAIGAIVLAWTGKAVPELLIAIGSASVGALAGLFAPTRSLSD